MADTDPESQERTYGGFMPVGRRGLFGLNLWAFFGLVLAMLPVIIIWITLGVKWGTISLILLVLVAVPMLLPKKDGRGVYQRWSAALENRIAKAMGSRDLVNGPAGNAPDGSFRVPGLAADSTISTQHDEYGHEYALISYPRQNHHVVVFECYPTGNALVDQASINKAVAHWGAWLAHLGTERRVVGAQVSIETTTDTGLRLRRAVTSRIADIAPGFARAVAAQILDRFNAAAPAINSKVSVTLSGAARGTDDETIDQEEAVAELSTIVPTLRDGLRMTGAGATVRSCTERDLVDYVRVAYDPTCSPDVEQLRTMGKGTGLVWEEAGPSVHRVAPDYYMHDGVVSASWTMARGPKEIIYDTSLANLLRPEPRVLRKRVTLVYRPEATEHTGAIVDQVEANSRFASSMNQSKARNSMVQAQAHQMAREEARGAGLVRQGLIVTCTVPSVRDVRIARQVIQTQASSTKMKIRSARGTQDTAFQAALPIGICLPYHSMVPVDVKDAM